MKPLILNILLVAATIGCVQDRIPDTTVGSDSGNDSAEVSQPDADFDIVDDQADPGADSQAETGLPDDSGLDGDDHAGTDTDPDSFTDDDADAGDPGDEAPGDADVSEIVDPCLHCPNSICDPETLECLECTQDWHCGLKAWCDDGTCRDNLCNPGANFCHQDTLFKCSENGAGFTIIMECLDNDPCTEGDRCENGRCVEGTRLDCADDNMCTIDYCSAGQCNHHPASDIACDDNNQCTKDDMCSQGVCKPGKPLDCGDGNICTLDYCTQLTGCIHEPVGGKCADQNGCTTEDRCIEGKCSGTPADCDDNDWCTTDYCYQGGCRHDRIQGCFACTDDSQCPAAGPCEPGECDLATGNCTTRISRIDGCCVFISDCPETPACVRPICDVNHQCRIGTLAQTGCCQPEVWKDDLSAGMNGEWLHENDSPEAGWREGLLTDIPGITAPSFYFGNEDETGYGTGYQASGSITSPPVMLPAASTLKLSFDLWMDVDPIGGYDELQIWVIAETSLGRIRKLLWDQSAQIPGQVTTPVTIDISGYSGRQVRFEFRFDTYDHISNDGRGVYLDNPAVTATCLPPACLADYHCRSAGINGFCRDSRCDFSKSWMQTSQFGEPGSLAGQFNSPTDLAVVPGPEGVGFQILVSDSRTHYVQVFDGSGKFVRILGGYGTVPGKFLSPRGIATSEGRVLIADNLNGRIQVMTPSGVFLYSFGKPGTDPGKLDTPRDVAISPDGNRIYVADTGNHRVNVYGRLGVFQFSFGAFGTTPGRFRTPSAISVGQDGRVWVCDTQNNRIQVFSADGVLDQVIKPDKDMALANPGGIVTLPGGGALVADTYNHRLIFFNNSGKVSGTLGTFGSGTDQFFYPSDVDLIGQGTNYQIVVADSGNYRITGWAVKFW